MTFVTWSFIVAIKRETEKCSRKYRKSQEILNLTCLLEAVCIPKKRAHGICKTSMAVRFWGLHCVKELCVIVVTIYHWQQPRTWSQQKELECATCELACALRVNKPCALLGNALFCARLFTTWTLQFLGHLSAQEVHKIVYLKCKLPEVVHLLCTHVSKDLKFPSGAQLTLRTKVHFQVLQKAC